MHTFLSTNLKKYFIAEFCQNNQQTYPKLLRLGKHLTTKSYKSSGKKELSQIHVVQITKVSLLLVAKCVYRYSS